MRVGIDCRMYDTGFTGIGRYVFNLVKYLLAGQGQGSGQQPYQYVLFFNQSQLAELPAELKQQAEVVVIDAPYYSWSEQLGYPRELRRQRLDLMHFTHFNAPLMYRGKVVVTIHDLTLSKYPSHKRNSPWHRAAYQLTLRNIVGRAEKVIAVSGNTKKDLVEMLGAEADKVAVIHEAPADNFRNDISEKLVRAAQQKYGLGDNYLLYTGVWRPHKNLVRLVEAFAALKRRGKSQQRDWSGLKLVIAGKENADYPDVRERVNLLGLRRAVVLPGFIADEDLPAVVKGAAIYVFPSLYEGFGLPPLEAMACGTPVCVANTSSLPEVCGLANAHYFDPLSVADMAEKLGELLADEGLREKYRQRGLLRAAEFSWPKMALATREIYDLILRPELVGAGS